MTDDFARRAAEVFAAALDQARAGRMTMAEVCAHLRTTSKTIKYHIGKGWISGTVENIGGKEMWLFDPDAVERYVKIRAKNEGRALQAARAARGGAKLAEAPPGFVTLIDVAAQTGHSMDFMRAAAPRLGFETFRGPRRVFMVRAEDVPGLIEAVAATPPRPGRQKKAGIHQKIVWTPEMDSALGKEPDGILAGRWGISPAAVQQRRVKMGVEAITPAALDYRSKPGKHVKWTNEMLGMLGKELDTDLAKKWGMSAQSVGRRRREARIPSYGANGIFWTAEMDSAFDRENDVSIAAQWGVSRAQVRKRRKELGIPPMPRGATSIVWTPEIDATLGTQTDTEIAARIGVSAPAVLMRRKKLNIPAFARKGNHSTKKKIMATPFPAALRAKIEEAKPVLLDRLRAAGIDLPDVTDEQVIGYALDQVIRQAAAAERGRGEAE